MSPISFIAESAVDAVAQIRERLGPDAVVLNIRRLPASGLSRLWSKPRIEVLAHVPEKVETKEEKREVGSEKRNGTAASLLDVKETAEVSLPTGNFDTAEAGRTQRQAGSIPSSLCARPDSAVFIPSSRYSMPGREIFSRTTLVDALGLLPRYAEKIMEKLSGTRSAPLAPLRSDLALVRDTLKGFWRHSAMDGAKTHVFIGPPGSGKTTVLCKWLTQTVLLEGASARVWRLDVPRANTGEALSVHGEILNVPVERSWNPGAVWPEQLSFIDLPGVEMSDTAAASELERLLSSMPDASISLVLNAAYDIRILEAQVRAFGRLPLSSLIFTHLDEEPRWSKLWNLVLGTNYPFSFLSAGQNIPGQFLRATPELLFSEEMRVL